MSSAYLTWHQIVSHPGPLSTLNFKTPNLLQLSSRIMREIHSLRGQDHPSLWDEDDVQRWLTSLAVDTKVCEAFSRHSIHGESSQGVSPASSHVTRLRQSAAGSDRRSTQTHHRNIVPGRQAENRV